MSWIRFVLTLCFFVVAHKAACQTQIPIHTGKAIHTHKPTRSLFIGVLLISPLRIPASLSTYALISLPSNHPGVGQNIAMHASPTARDFFLSKFYLPALFVYIFLKPLPGISCVSCGHSFLCGPVE